MLKLLVLHYVWNGCNSQNKINKPYLKHTKPILQKKKKKYITFRLF